MDTLTVKVRGTRFTLRFVCVYMSVSGNAHMREHLASPFPFRFASKSRFKCLLLWMCMCVSVLVLLAK